MAPPKGGALYCCALLQGRSPHVPQVRSLGVMLCTGGLGGRLAWNRLTRRSSGARYRARTNAARRSRHNGSLSGARHQHRPRVQHSLGDQPGQQCPFVRALNATSCVRSEHGAAGGAARAVRSAPGGLVSPLAAQSGWTRDESGSVSECTTLVCVVPPRNVLDACFIELPQGAAPAPAAATCVPLLTHERQRAWMPSRSNRTSPM